MCMLRTAATGVWSALTRRKQWSLLCCSIHLQRKCSLYCCASNRDAGPWHLPEPPCFSGNCDARVAGLGFRGFPSADRRTHQGREGTERAAESAQLLRRTAVGEFCGVPTSVAQCELIFNACLQRGRDAQRGNDAILLCCRRESGQ